MNLQDRIPEYEKVVLEYRVSVCLYMCGCAPELLDELYSYSVFKGLSLISRCSVNKAIELQTGP
jgi:hypothetical protein